MNKYNKPVITIEQFSDMHYIQKMRLCEIASELNMYPDHLSAYVRNILGLNIIHYRHKSTENITDEQKSVIISDYEETKCIKEIMSRYNLSRGAITIVLKEFGFNIKENKNKRQSSQLKGRNKRTTSEYNEYCENVGITVLDEYNGVENNIQHQCNKCDYIWLASPGNVIHNKSGCPECANKEGAKARALKPEVYVKRLAEFCPNLEVLEDYINYSAKILHRCKTCGYEWKTRPICRPTESGCRQCVTPSGNFGTHTVIDGLEFDSKLESEFYLELNKIFTAKEIIHKKWYNNRRYCSDFYISKLDLWIEVSNFNTIEYLEKIWAKRKLVNNFVFFTELNQVEKYFKGEKE